MNGVAVLGEAISTMSDVNMESQIGKSAGVVTMISAMAALSLDWSKQWDQDAEQYYTDSLQAVGDQSATATAAADYSEYQVDLQQGQLEIGGQDSLLQNDKAILVLGN